MRGNSILFLYCYCCQSTPQRKTEKEETTKRESSLPSNAQKVQVVSVYWFAMKAFFFLLLIFLGLTEQEEKSNLDKIESMKIVLGAHKINFSC